MSCVPTGFRKFRAGQKWGEEFIEIHVHARMSVVLMCLKYGHDNTMYCVVTVAVNQLHVENA